MAVFIFTVTFIVSDPQAVEQRCFLLIKTSARFFRMNWIKNVNRIVTI